MRRGFTLVEILVAMTLTVAVFAITLPFLRVQTRALGTSAGRLDADQIARYAQRAIDRDLRLAVADAGQPLLVMAGPMAISFNANLTAADTSDPAAADVETGGATTLTESWRLSDARALPTVARSYPVADYLDATGTVSRNETISYFLHPDTVTGRSDLYVLYRRVNARDSVQIVRSVHVPTDSAFFGYLRLENDTLSRIADSRLPLYWDSTAIDSVRAVQLRPAGYYKNQTTGTEAIRTVHWRTALPNAVPRQAAGCSADPGAPSGIAQNRQTSPRYYVRVTWDASSEDDGTSVTDYQVGTRPSGSTEFTVIATITASGLNDYRWDHQLPDLTGGVKYGVRSIACGGTMSAWVIHNSTLTLP